MRSLRIAAAALIFAVAPALAEPQHGIAMHGLPALAADFTHLPYANPDAPQGGTLHQAATGSFDSLNPMIVKGQPASGPRTYVFESLLGRNLAEPFSLYGLLAESIDANDDRSAFTFKLRSSARFSDGKPVTSADVAFTAETLKTKGRPNFRNYLAKVTSIVTPDALTITFTQDGGDRELPMLLGLMPILPKHFFEARDFEASTVEPLLGSGPYIFGEIVPGERVVYRKNPAYWGKSLPLARGVWNFDAVQIDYYRDNNSAFEAFKKGLADVRIEADPGRWQAGYDFPAVTEGKVILEKIVQKTPAPASGFVFNTRRKVFADRKLREAMLWCFDFEWANANLFSGLYQRTYGYYSGSELSSRGIAADAKELAILGAAKDTLDPRILDGSYALPVSDGSGRDRKLLRKAVGLFKEAGYEIRDGKMVNAAGEPLSFTLIVLQTEQEKIGLHYQGTLTQLGVDMQVRRVDSAEFQRIQQTYDYDMVPATWFNSLSPGNEQSFYYGSAARDEEGTRNYPGIADPAVDAAIRALTTSTAREDFVAAVRALDRLLVNGVYIVPFYDAGGQWVARWSTIGRPDAQPLQGFEATALWRNP